MAKTNDFGNGPVWRRIVDQAIPLTVAQLVHLLYNVVDRVYLGHLEDADGLALTGVGLTFPVITLIMAFTSLFGNGGVPLFSMARGAGDNEKAGKILGNSFCLLLSSAVVLTVIGYAFHSPLLFLFGASEESFGYAAQYLRIYLAGTVFSMLTTGLNGYINAQGRPQIGMLSVVIGAAVNIALDPVFIFVFDMGGGRRRACNGYKSGIFRCVGACFPFLQECACADKVGKCSYRHRDNKGNSEARHSKLYYAGHELSRSGGKQFDASDIRRRYLRRNYDGNHLGARHIYASRKRYGKRRTAHYQLQLRCEKIPPCYIGH